MKILELIFDIKDWYLGKGYWGVVHIGIFMGRKGLIIGLISMFKGKFGIFLVE